jgi:serine/threonine-protein kinase RsbW
MSEQLVIQSRTEHLREARDFVAGLARDFGFDEEMVGMISLAVDEACTNVIKHAYQYASDKKIVIHVSHKNGAFEIQIKDEGKSFDPAIIQSPNMKEYLSHFRRGGLGMHLMRSLMDNVEYKSNGNNNVVRMVKYLSDKKPA